MKKSLLTACAAAALGLFAMQAHAADVTEPAPEESIFYVSLFGGASFLDDVDTLQDYDTGNDFSYSLNTKTGYIVGGAIGARVWDPVRAEVELSYARWKADDYTGEILPGGTDFADETSGHLSATYLLANLWIDIENDTAFTPYVGGGAGVAWVDASGIEFPTGLERYGYNNGEMGFAFQAGAGVHIGVAENIAIDVGYRFKGILDIDFEGGEDDVIDYEGGDLYSHNVQAGVIFGF